jgi:AhpD family alkylhydroperoxidase
LNRKSAEEIKNEVKSSYGFVPGFIEDMIFEDPAADILWELSKHYDEEETNIPMKYKHLLCFAVAAAIRCPYCIAYHKLMCEMNGANQKELQEAALHALKVTGSSAFIHGMQYPLDKFNQELQQIKDKIEQQSK